MTFILLCFIRENGGGQIRKTYYYFMLIYPHDVMNMFWIFYKMDYCILYTIEVWIYPVASRPIEAKRPYCPGGGGALIMGLLWHAHTNLGNGPPRNLHKWFTGQCCQVACANHIFQKKLPYFLTIFRAESQFWAFSNKIVCDSETFTMNTVFLSI
jgi:hypothetical protein